MATWSPAVTAPLCSVRVDSNRQKTRSISFEPLRIPGERPVWRPDIEGLRGVAVLLVVLYHADFPGFSGGYVGVDVFFALSGYLITSILVAEVERSGRVDLVRFYARRARRLLPASAVLLLAVAAFAFVFYSPLEQEGIASTALATALYLSNVWFARDATNYFAAGAETNPLLHTWSLAVEEQFYLGWPLLVVVGLVGLPWLGRRLKLSHRRLVWTMVGVSVATFALTVYLMGTLQTHWAFFASPARAWEFALGGLGAILPRLRLTSGRGVGVVFNAQLIGWIGLTAVVGAGIFYGARTPFPGWTALVPVVGTVCVLRAGVGQPATLLGKLLSWRPLLEAGRLSYSWYLWHWPVLVFAEGLVGKGVGEHLSLPVRLGLLLISLGLAEASYRLVEDPIRHQRWLAAKSWRGIALLGALTAFGLVLSLAWKQAVGAAAVSPEQVAYAQAARDKAGTECIAQYEVSHHFSCTAGDTTSSRVILLYGDSHARHWLPAVEQFAEKRGWRVETALKVACGAFDATPWSGALGRPYTECDSWRKSATAFADSLQPDLIIVSTSFTGYGSIGRDEWEPATSRLLQRLAESSQTVTVLRDVPRPPSDSPACLSRATWRGLDPSKQCSFPHDRDQGVNVYDVQVASASLIPSAEVLDLNELVCTSDICRPIRSGDAGPVVVWQDSHHITSAFASLIFEEFDSALYEATRSIQRPR
ncbi:MAG: acyltransferase family protein [Bacteroidota bacterium]